MASILTITNSEILQLCRLDTADAINLADATEVVGKGQEAYELQLSGPALANAALTPLLRRSVAQLLAADLLDIRVREDGRSQSIQAAGVTLGKPVDLAVALRSQAWQTLAPYRLRPALAVITPASLSPVRGEAQAALFGEDESTRRFVAC